MRIENPKYHWLTHILIPLSFFLVLLIPTWRWISAYNAKVYEHQLALANAANGKANFWVTDCAFYYPVFYWVFLSLTAFTLSLFFTKRLLLSSLFSFFIIINLVINLVVVDFLHLPSLLDNYFGIDWYNNYFLIEASLLFLILSFSFAEAFLISRFVDKKFHAKIFFR